MLPWRLNRQKERKKDHQKKEAGCPEKKKTAAWQWPHRGPRRKTLMGHCHRRGHALAVKIQLCRLLKGSVPENFLELMPARFASSSRLFKTTTVRRMGGEASSSHKKGGVADLQVGEMSGPLSTNSRGLIRKKVPSCVRHRHNRVPWPCSIPYRVSRRKKRSAQGKGKVWARISQNTSTQHTKKSQVIKSFQFLRPDSYETGARSLLIFSGVRQRVCNHWYLCNSYVCGSNNRKISSKKKNCRSEWVRTDMERCNNFCEKLAQALALAEQRTSCGAAERSARLIDVDLMPPLVELLN